MSTAGPVDHVGEIHNGRVVLERAADTVTPRRRKKCGREIVVSQRTRNWKVRCLACGAERVLGWQCIRLKGCYPIDRMDNTIGYVLDNVVSCCGACNRAKGARPYGEFVAWLDRIARFRREAERVA